MAPRDLDEAAEALNNAPWAEMSDEEFDELAEAAHAAGLVRDDDGWRPRVSYAEAFGGESDEEGEGLPW